MASGRYDQGHPGAVGGSIPRTRRIPPPLRSAAPTAGFNGAARSHRPLPMWRGEKPGVQGGRSIPLASPQCSTLRGLA